MLHRLGHRLFGDGVEHHALDLLLLERALFLQHFEHVPGNGFAFAIRIGGEDERFGALYGLSDVGEAFGCLGIHLPDHLEVLLGIDRPVLGGQVADMTEGGQNFIARTQIFIDGLRLGGRLHDDNFHENPMS
jgi:hypothetical protein